MTPIQEVESALRKYRDHAYAKKWAHVTNSHLEQWGIKVPLTRNRLKQGFSFSHVSHQKQAKIWSDIWKGSRVHEVRYLPLYYFESRIKQLTKADWRILESWAERIENWGHSDQLAKLYAQLYEQFPDQVYPTLKKWNRSKNPWLRRLSVTSLFLYSSSRKIQPAFNRVIELVTPLLKDADAYVRKGVGWTLREAHNVYPKEARAFVKKHIRDLPAVTFSYATEKYPKSVREQLKKMRKAG